MKKTVLAALLFLIVIIAFKFPVAAQETTQPPTVPEAEPEYIAPPIQAETQTPIEPTYPIYDTISPAPVIPYISPVEPETLEYMEENQGSVLSATAPTIQLEDFEPGEAAWRIDAEVTQVGRNAERARQLIYWVVTHPMQFKAPVLSEIGVFTRNVALAMMTLVIVGLAIQLVLRKTSIGPTFTGISIGYDRITIINIVIRIVSLLVFIFLAHTIVLLFIQLADALSQFFIEYLGGEDLFNIFFSGKNSEGNYSFVGWKNMDPYEQDMVFTSLFLVRFTSFTYNVISIVLILRHVILMFLLVLSPFLALLLPFIFIRNTGYIWIGEFLRWLFYGPLFALFLAAMATIWKAGIPYGFDFSRVDQPDGQIYNTGINILYGGPAQSLSETNSANYVDTYAEYIIALVMLWAALILPWLLLRIFRDYCCDILEKNRGVLLQILDKMRNIVPPAGPPPKPPEGPKPTTTFGKEMNLPTSEKSVTNIQDHTSKERIIERINNKEVHTVDTNQITRAFNLQVHSIKDVARFETNRQTSSAVKETLSNIQNPYSIQNPQTRAQYETLRNEFTSRASKGDQTAKNVVSAATPRASTMASATSGISSVDLKAAMQKPGVPQVVPHTTSVTHVSTQSITSSNTISSIAQKTKVSQNKVEQILKAVPLAGASSEHIEKIAEKTHTDRETVEKVLEHVSTITRTATADSTIEKIATEKQLSHEQVEKILTTVPLAGAVTKETIKESAQKTQLSEEKVKQVLSATREVKTTDSTTEEQIITTVSEKTQISKEKVAEVLATIPTVKPETEKAISTAAKETGLTEEQVHDVLASSPKEIAVGDSSQDSSAPGTQAPAKPNVSIEEYEDVRKMWTNHYRKSEVPVSENIKDRQAWIDDDIKRLTNTIDLLTSASMKDRQKGMNEVANLLPFMMLGGFTDLETLTYLKAKLEAAKLTQEELTHVQEATEKMKQAEEDLVSIPATKSKTAEESMEKERALKMDLPEDTKEDNSQEKQQEQTINNQPIPIQPEDKVK